MPWHNKQTYGYTRQSSEAADNATMVMDILTSLGWGKAAVCAALGNFEAESDYNPWRWQSETVLPVNDSRIGVVCGDNTAHAYGIFQSDPAANYIYRSQSPSYSGYGPNYSNQSGSQNDGTAQMHYLEWVCSNYSDGSCGGWNQNYLSAIPFATFKAQEDLSVYTMNRLVKIFHDGYERSARWDATGVRRTAAGNYWWEYFSGYVPPTPSGGNGVWFAVFRAIKKRKSNFYAQPRKRGGKIWRCLYRFKLKILSRPAIRRTAL